MLRGKTAFVTGASQGIGQRIAVTLAEEGANVALAARSDGIYETEELIGRDTALTLKTDVSDEASVEQSIADTVAEFGGLDLLVNNAGIAGPTAPIEDVSEEEWDRTFDVNLKGMFLTTKHAASHLRRSDEASIVNIASISGKRPLANRTPYTASKMGVIGLTRTLALEFGDDGVTVNAICPGPVSGDRIDRVIDTVAEEEGVPREEVKRGMTDDLTIEEFVDPEDVAQMTVHLASEQGRHVTAQDINIDSGATWY